MNHLDENTRRKISQSVKPTITNDRRKKMSDSMKGFWAKQRAKDKEIVSLKKKVKHLESQLPTQN